MSDIFHVDFYPKDWMIDTQRLTLEERGVYVQVMAAVSYHGPIDHDERWLASLCNCSVRKVRTLLTALADKGFISIANGKVHQKRAEKELEKARKRSENAAKNARKLHEKHPKNARKNAEKEAVSNKNKDLASASHQSPDTRHIADDDSACASENHGHDSEKKKRPHIAIGEIIWQLTGWADDPNKFPDYSRIEQWLANGWEPEKDIFPTVKRIMAKRESPPGSLKYFEKAIADAHATRNAPLPKGEPNAKRRSTRSGNYTTEDALEDVLADIDARYGEADSPHGGAMLCDTRHLRQDAQATGHAYDGND